MIIKTVKGNIFELAPKENCIAIAHGCNTFNNFGAGIAKIILELYPEAYEADTVAHKLSQNGLGFISNAYVSKSDFYLINCYTQNTLGWNHQHDAPPVDYTAIYRCFLKINTWYKSLKNSNNRPVCIPAIGAGLAKGNLEIIKQLINIATPNTPIILYLL